MRVRPLLGVLVAAGCVLAAMMVVASSDGGSAEEPGPSAVEPSRAGPARPVSAGGPASDAGAPRPDEAGRAPVLRGLGPDRTAPIPEHLLGRPAETRSLDGPPPPPPDEWDAGELDLPEGEEYRDPEWEWPEDEEPEAE